MPQYMLSVHTVEGEAREPMTDEEMQQSWARISALNDELKSAGAWVFAGALHGPDTATVVRMSDGEVLTTDGPFAEAKEHLGGFYAIEAEDLDAVDRQQVLRHGGPPPAGPQQSAGVSGSSAGDAKQVQDSV